MKQAAILWVEVYSSHVSLFLSKETAEGFAKGLGVGEAELYRKKENQVRESLLRLQTGGKPAPADVAPILYYSGHGTVEGPKFNDGQVAAAHEIVLGQNVAVAAFDCCLMMDRHEPWGQAFRGLRYMLGFSRSPSQHALRGATFALRLKEGHVISEAWRMATTQTQAASWRSLRAFVGMTQPPEDTWPTPGPYATVGPFKFVCRSEDDCPLLLAPSDVAPQEISLFRTPAPKEEELSPAAIAERFQLKDLDIVPGHRSRQVHGQDSILEVFNDSHSIWWNRRYEQSTELFKIPAAPGSVPPGTIVALASLILGQPGLSYSLGQPWETFTTETHQNLDGSRSLIFQVTRHLEFPLRLGGLSVLGPGARLRSSVERDRMSEFLLFTRKAVNAGTKPIMRLADAKKILRTDAAFRPVSKFVQILRCSLAYYALSPSEPQDHLIPVYVFEGIVNAEELPMYRFVRFVQAIPEEVRHSEFPDSSVLRKMGPVFS